MKDGEEEQRRRVVGRRLPKRMTPSRSRQEPTRIASPRMSSAFENSAPSSEVFATTISPAFSAKRTTEISGMFAECRLEHAGCRGPDPLAERFRRERDRPGEARPAPRARRRARRRRSPRSAGCLRRSSGRGSRRAAISRVPAEATDGRTPCGRTSPPASARARLAGLVGADRQGLRSSSSSARNARWRSWIGTSTSTTASATASLNFP